MYHDGAGIYAHDFARGLPSDWDSWRTGDLVHSVPAAERLSLSGDALLLGRDAPVMVDIEVPEHRSDRFRIEIEMAGPAWVMVGEGTEEGIDNPHCRLRASAQSTAYPHMTADLYSSGGSYVEDRRSVTHPDYAPPRGRYTLTLGLDSGKVEATVPGFFPDLVWSTTDTPTEPLSAWTSLAAVEGGFALLTIADRLYSVSPASGVKKAFIAPLGGDIAEARVWEDPAEAGMYHVGLCVPDLHSIYVDRARAPSSRSRGVTVMSNKRWSLSDAAGPDPGSFLFPLSFAIGPNGRIYVLDAGNSRIQVFSADGEYITQWGRRGSGPGEFDFGQGMAPEDFRGSIAVDDGGYIFAADPGNRRIQVFSP